MELHTQACLAYVDNDKERHTAASIAYAGGDMELHTQICAAAGGGMNYCDGDVACSC